MVIDPIGSGLIAGCELCEFGLSDHHCAQFQQSRYTCGSLFGDVIGLLLGAGLSCCFDPTDVDVILHYEAHPIQWLLPILADEVAKEPELSICLHA